MDSSKDLVTVTLPHSEPEATISVAGKPGSGSGPTSSESATLPGYEILGVLGHGGMGVVYRARQTNLKRVVALKMILAGRHAGAEHLARFHSEAEAVARLQHPHIVQIYEVGEHQGLPWFSLEYVEGGNLAQHLAGNPQPPPLAAQVVETLARAVHYAHLQGIVHRDLKPANILLQVPVRGDIETGGSLPVSAGPAFSPKITDFGLAKHLEDDSLQTQTGAIMGTPSYMAPEQAAGKSRTVGPATDVYALGAILYEMLTGRPPFKAATVLDTAQLVLNQEPVPPRKFQPKVPLDLETICLKCLRKEPLHRYASAEALAEDLRRFQANEAILARPAGFLERLFKWAKRRKALTGLLLVSVLATLALLAGWIVFTLQIQEQRDRAQREYQRAEANFQRALQVVNFMLATASDKTFEYEPRLQEKRAAMLTTARQLFEGFLTEKSDDPEVRQKTAQAQQKVADLYRLLQEPHKAAQAYQQAIALLSQFADRPEGRAALAECHNWHGEVLRNTSQLAAAQGAFQEARQLLKNLVRDFPQELSYRKDWARSYYNCGIVLKESNQPQNAEKEFRTAIGVLEEPVPASANGQLATEMLEQEALCYLNLATVLADLQQAQGAVEASTKAIAILAKVVESPSATPEYRFDLAVAHNNRGTFWAPLYQGEAKNGASKNQELMQKAETDHRQAVVLLDKLGQDYPRYPKYNHELANTLNSLGGLLVARHHKKDARAAWNQAKAILEKLVTDYPQTADFHGDLGMTLGNLGWLAGQEAQWPEARFHLQKAIVQVEAALEPNPQHPDYRQALRNQYRDLSQAQRHLKDHAGAAQAALAFIQASRQTKEDYFLAASYLAQCLPLAEADPDLSLEKRRQCGSRYAEDAVQMLHEARVRGFTNFDPVFTGPVFDPLRRHPAFDSWRKETP